MFLYAVSRRVCRPHLSVPVQTRDFSCTASNSRKKSKLDTWAAEYAKMASEHQPAYPEEEEDTAKPSGLRYQRAQEERLKRSRENQEEGARGAKYDSFYELADADRHYVDLDDIKPFEDAFSRDALPELRKMWAEKEAQKPSPEAEAIYEKFKFFNSPTAPLDLTKDDMEQTFTAEQYAKLEEDLDLYKQGKTDNDHPEIEAEVQQVLQAEEEMHKDISKLLPGSDECVTPKIYGILVDKYVFGTISEKIAAELIRLKIQTWNEAFPHVENMIIGVRRRAPLLKRKLQLELRRVERHREKYGEINLARAKKAKLRRKEFLETVKNDPNWFHYPKINLWIQRHYLEYGHVRAAIRTILDNVTYTRKQKKEAIEAMVTYIRNAEEKPKEWYTRRRKLFYEGISRFDNVSNVRSPDLTKDPNFKIPETYEELIARAEAEMASEDKSARYGPPVQKGAKTNKKLINEY